jgi:outer membrane receptor for ferrienterochelin and colicin
MPADNIERIEIIHQPDASFDADGTGGVINVILKKNVMLGTNGTFLLAGGMGKLPKYRTALAINHGAGPWRLSFNGGYMYRSNYEELHLNRKVGEQQFDQSNYKPSKPGTGYFRSNIDWTPSTRHIFGLSLGYTGTQNNRLHTNTTAIGAVDATPYLELETNNELNKRAQQYNAGGNYTFLIDSSGQKLEADVSWIGLNRQGSSLANTAVTLGESVLFPSWRNDEPSETNIAVGKVDYTRPLTKALKMQAGAKYSYANIDNNLRSWNETGGEWVSNPQQTNHFVYTEHTGAAYINASYSNKNWEANAGLRYEDNSAIGRSLTLDSTKSRRLQQLFPSFSLAAPMGKHFGMSASYSYRIERPSYQTLNPFIN